jgi:hypothetical protein
MIIETHGQQHYEGWGRDAENLKYQKENDMLKYNLAIQNGIDTKNYIVINCHKSDFKWLKENFVNSLKNYFDLSNIDYTQCFYGLKETDKTISIYELYSQNNTVYEISEKLN